MPQLSSLLDRFQPSAIAQIFSHATRLRETGKELWSFSTGEPDFDTPDHIRAAAKRAIDEGDTHYTPTDGRSALKEAVQGKFQRDNDLDYSVEQIVIGMGAKPLLTNAIQAVVDQGDEVILTTPCWPSHVGMTMMAGGQPIRIETGSETGFKMSPEMLEAVITSRTRLVLLCSPSNPTGAVYSAQELEGLAAVFRKHPQIWILTDDLYEHILFDDMSFATIAQVAPDLKDRVLTVNGVSKGYAMTGWRIGYAGGPDPWIRGIQKIFSQTNGGPCSISQAAATEALNGPQDFLRDWAQVYQSRRDLALSYLGDCPGLTCAPPAGAFYLLPNCSSLLGKTTPQGQTLQDSSQLADHLLNDWGIVVVPGAGFDCGPYFRISVATSEEVIKGGLERLVKACSSLS
ncbi:MAG: pyridoxal phosphate-dependent aminotransferase [Pseudomonadota bacterium]